MFLLIFVKMAVFYVKNCAILNCTSNNPTTPTVPPLFRFPRDPERCKRWVESCHRSDLDELTPEQLYKHHRICAKHFEPFLIDTTSQNAAVLKDEATPTIFDSTDHPSYHSKSLQNKRKIEPTKAAPMDLKIKKKDSTDKTKKNKEGTEEQDQGDFFKLVFDALLMLTKQNIPLSLLAEEGQESLVVSNVQTLLEYRINAGDEALKKRCEFVRGKLCSTSELKKMVEISENCIRAGLLLEVKEARFFSLVTGDVVEIESCCHLPVFLRFVDQSNCLREEFAGLLPFDADEETLTDQLLSEVTKKWGLSMENCRGQAHLSSGVHARKMKAIATKIAEKYPLALRSTLSPSTLNTSLAGSMSLSGVQLVMSTFNKIETFFKDCLLLQLELENAISIFYQGREEKANELKEACRGEWTARHDAFEMAIDIVESLLLCVDSVHDNEDLRWSDEVTHDALEISKALADFEFIISLVVLKNTLSFTRAFGKNLQEQATDIYSAANNLTAVLHSLNEVSENIDVYHEFWFEEAVNLATAMEIPVKVPRLFLRKHRSESGTEPQPENYYKEHLSLPVVNHILSEMSDLFTERHIKAMRCLSLIPAVMGQLKFEIPKEENVQVYKGDLPNADTLAAELNCWGVKWKHRTKDVVLPTSINETLLLADVKFFPNVLTFLKVLSTLPMLMPGSISDAAHNRFKIFMENTPEEYRSKSLTFLNMHPNAKYDLDLMVGVYMKSEKKEMEEKMSCE